MKDARRSPARKSVTLIGASLAALVLSAISGCNHNDTPGAVLIPPEAPVQVSAPADTGPPAFVFNDRCVPYEIRNGPRKLDSAVSEILHGIQAAKLRLA